MTSPQVCAPSNLNLGLLPWSALAGGALSGKYLVGDGHADGGPALSSDALRACRLTLFADRYERFTTPQVQRAVAAYCRCVAACMHASPAVHYMTVRGSGSRHMLAALSHACVSVTLSAAYQLGSPQGASTRYRNQTPGMLEYNSALAYTRLSPRVYGGGRVAGWRRRRASPQRS
jgi:hypothetical protein